MRWLLLGACIGIVFCLLLGCANVRIQLGCTAQAPPLQHGRQAAVCVKGK